MTEELARSYATLERRISERTRDLEAVRDLLDAFFRISTSRLDPDNIDKTFDSRAAVLLPAGLRPGDDLAGRSRRRRDPGGARDRQHDRRGRADGAAAGRGRHPGRRGARESRDRRPRFHGSIRGAIRPRWRCRAFAARSSCRWSAIEVLGTLQVASRSPLDPDRLDLRPLETLATHTARALTGLRQLEEIRRLNQSQEQHAQELARSEAALREQTRILQSVLDCMGDGVVVADSNGRFLVFNPAAERILGHGRIDSPPEEWSRHYEIFLPDRVTPYPVEDLPLMRAIRGESADQAELYIAYPSRDDGTWILVTGRPLRDEHGELQGGVVVFHDITRRKKAERRLAAQYETTRVLAEADSPAQANAEDPRDHLREPGLGLRRVLESRPARAAAALRDDLAPAGGVGLRVRGPDAEIDPGARRRAAGPRLGRRPARLDPGDRPRRQTFPGARPPSRTACTPPSPCRSCSEATAWASSSSSATRPGRPTPPSWK